MQTYDNAFASTPFTDLLHETQPVELNPLSFDMSDEDINITLDEYKNGFKNFYSEKNLFSRQDENFSYLLGNQVNPKRIPRYSLPYKENIIHEGLLRIKPIALSRLPDLLITPGNDSEQSKIVAEELTDVINSDLRKRQNRKVLGMAHKHEPIFFYGVVKTRWNPEKDDYEYLTVHPKKVFFDWECTTNDVEDMRFFGEKVKRSVEEWIMMFPKRKEAFLDYLGFKDNERKDKKKLATKVEGEEVWFTTYDKKTNPQTGREEYTRIDGTVWRYQSFIFDKIKNPYFDYEGYDKFFTYENGMRNEMSEEDVYEILFTDDYQSKKVFNNYFKCARKPYFLMVYENWGEHPVDETTRVEQVKEFQDNINDSGRQAGDMNRRSVGKDIYNTQAIDKKDIAKLDPANPRQAIGVDGTVRDVYQHVQAPPAPAQLYNSIESNRAKGFELLGVNATTRGVRQSGDQTLGGMQLEREADFGLIDDIVEDTINACAEWQAQWALQFIKLFYTKPKMKKIVGKHGDLVFNSLSQDIVEDGMEVETAASGVDKIERKRMAINNMQMGVGDPLSYYEDTEQSQPKERALRAMLAQGTPMQYIQKYLMDENSQQDMTQGMIAQLQDGQQPPVQPPMQPGAEAPQGMPMGGGGDWRWYSNQK